MAFFFTMGKSSNEMGHCGVPCLPEGSTISFSTMIYPCHCGPCSTTRKAKLCDFLFIMQGGAPPSFKRVIIPLNIDISPINHSEIGHTCTNLANELGHHPAITFPPYFTKFPVRNIEENPPARRPMSYRSLHHAVVAGPILGTRWKIKLLKSAI